MGVDRNPRFLIGMFFVTDGQSRSRGAFGNGFWNLDSYCTDAYFRRVAQGLNHCSSIYCSNDAIPNSLQDLAGEDAKL